MLSLIKVILLITKIGENVFKNCYHGYKNLLIIPDKDHIPMKENTKKIRNKQGMHQDLKMLNQLYPKVSSPKVLTFCHLQNSWPANMDKYT